MAVGVLIHIHRKADDFYFTILFRNTVEARFYKIYYLAKQSADNNASQVQIGETKMEISKQTQNAGDNSFQIQSTGSIFILNTQEKFFPFL